jgi:hypothetical protein
VSETSLISIVSVVRQASRVTALDVDVDPAQAIHSFARTGRGYAYPVALGRAGARLIFVEDGGALLRVRHELPLASRAGAQPCLTSRALPTKLHRIAQIALSLAASGVLCASVLAALGSHLPRSDWGIGLLALGLYVAWGLAARLSGIAQRKLLSCQLGLRQRRLLRFLVGPGRARVPYGHPYRAIA